MYGIITRMNLFTHTQKQISYLYINTRACFLAHVRMFSKLKKKNTSLVILTKKNDEKNKQKTKDKGGKGGGGGGGDIKGKLEKDQNITRDKENSHVKIKELKKSNSENSSMFKTTTKNWLSHRDGEDATDHRHNSSPRSMVTRTHSDRSTEETDSLHRMASFVQRRESISQMSSDVDNDDDEDDAGSASYPLELTMDVADNVPDGTARHNGELVGGMLTTSISKSTTSLSETDTLDDIDLTEDGISSNVNTNKFTSVETKVVDAIKTEKSSDDVPTKIVSPVVSNAALGVRESAHPPKSTNTFNSLFDCFIIDKTFSNKNQNELDKPWSHHKKERQQQKAISSNKMENHSTAATTTVSSIPNYTISQNITSTRREDIEGELHISTRTDNYLFTRGFKYVSDNDWSRYELNKCLYAFRERANRLTHEVPRIVYVILGCFVNGRYAKPVEITDIFVNCESDDIGFIPHFLPFLLIEALFNGAQTNIIHVLLIHFLKYHDRVTSILIDFIRLLTDAILYKTVKSRTENDNKNSFSSPVISNMTDTIIMDSVASIVNDNKIKKTNNQNNKKKEKEKSKDKKMKGKDKKVKERGDVDSKKNNNNNNNDNIVYDALARKLNDSGSITKMIHHMDNNTLFYLNKRCQFIEMDTLLSTIEFIIDEFPRDGFKAILLSSLLNQNVELFHFLTKNPKYAKLYSVESFFNQESQWSILQCGDVELLTFLDTALKYGSDTVISYDHIACVARAGGPISFFTYLIYKFVAACDDSSGTSDNETALYMKTRFQSYLKRDMSASSSSPTGVQTIKPPHRYRKMDKSDLIAISMICKGVAQGGDKQLCSFLCDRESGMYTKGFDCLLFMYSQSCLYRRIDFCHLIESNHAEMIRKKIKHIKSNLLGLCQEGMESGHGDDSDESQRQFTMEDLQKRRLRLDVNFIGLKKRIKEEMNGIIKMIEGHS